MATPTIGEFTGFPPEAFAFYAGLEDDNSNAYFDEHRDTYDHLVRLPMEELLAAAADEFGDDAKVFRPNRDVRFSKDKSPYKTSAAAVIGNGPDGRPAYYVQLSASGLMSATGYHTMQRDQVDRFYSAIDEDRTGKELEGILALAREAGYDVGGSELKTGPRGYPKDHERIELLRHKSLTLSQSWPVYKWMHTRETYDRVTSLWRAAEPMNQWLQDHVGATSMERDGRPR